MSEGRELPRPASVAGTAGRAGHLPASRPPPPPVSWEWVLIKKPQCEPEGWVPTPCHGV